MLRNQKRKKERKVQIIILGKNWRKWLKHTKKNKNDN